MRRFIKRIQEADEKTKAIWLVLLSGATMAVVVSLWMAYMNVMVAKVESSSGAVASKIEKDGTGFVDIFGAGISRIAEQIRLKLSAKNDIIISNQERDFMAEGVAEIQKTKLP